MQHKKNLHSCQAEYWRIGIVRSDQLYKTKSLSFDWPANSRAELVISTLTLLYKFRAFLSNNCIHETTIMATCHQKPSKCSFSIKKAAIYVKLLNFNVFKGHVSTFSKTERGSVAEESNALVLGTSPSRRGFETHRCHIVILHVNWCMPATYYLRYSLKFTNFLKLNALSYSDFYFSPCQLNVSPNMRLLRDRRRC
jgi:hypothetical protein